MNLFASVHGIIKYMIIDADVRWFKVTCEILTASFEASLKSRKNT